MARVHAWTWTLNNYTEAHLAKLKALEAKETCKYMVWGEERGEKKGTPHLQGYTVWKSAKTLSACVKSLGADHVEPRGGNAQQAECYCKKGEQKEAEYKEYNSVKNPMLPEHNRGPNWGKNARVTEWGNNTEQGKRNDIAGPREDVVAGESLATIALSATSYQGLRSAQLLMDILEPTRRGKAAIRWIWGDRAPAMRKARAYLKDGFYRKSEPKSKWWNKYDRHKEVLMDGWPDDKTAQKLLLQNICEDLPWDVETKGGTRQFVAETIVIVTEQSPRHHGVTPWWIKEYAIEVEVADITTETAQKSRGNTSPRLGDLECRPLKVQKK